MPRSTAMLNREQDFEHLQPSVAPWRGLVLATGFAVGLHAIVILGIRFTVFPKFPEQPIFSLNVNLVEEAGGTAAAAVGGELQAINEQILEPTTMPDTMAAESEQALVETTATATSGVVETQVTKQALVTTQVSQTPITFAAEQSPPTAPLQLEALPRQNRQNLLPTTPNELDPAGTGLRVARLTAEAEDAASNSREKTIDSSDSSTLEGYYAESWRVKVEHIGTLNFPAEARRRQVVGRLTLDVAIRADGSVHSIKMLESSGYPLLDRAARRIVYLASPFEPFPEPLRQRYDLLHIVRTWEFDQGNRLRSSD